MASSPSSAFSSPSAGRGFLELDDRLVARVPGATLVRAPLALHGAVMAHGARRLSVGGGRALRVVPGAATTVFGELCARLGLLLDRDSRKLARAVVAELGSKQRALVAPWPERAFEVEVAQQMIEIAPGSGAVLLFVAGPEGAAPGAHVIDVAAELSEHDRHRWVEAAANAFAERTELDSLGALEEFWASVHAHRRGAHLGSEMSEGASALHCALVAAGRSLPVAFALEAGSRVALDELVQRELVSEVDGFVVFAEPPTTARAIDARGAATVAALLRRAFPEDAAASLRAAELFLDSGDAERADAAYAAALLTASEDKEFCRDAAARWRRALVPIAGADARELFLRAARRSLDFGAPQEALEWCDSVRSQGRDDAIVSLVRARALVATGDLVAARVAVQRAHEQSSTDSDRAAAHAEAAELDFLAGDIAASEREASRALELVAEGDSAETHLLARNTLGKILLHKGEYSAADEHFARDVATSQSVGASRAELRARLNRAIACMSKGDVDASQTMLERVLDDAERLGQPRAVLHAVSNLAVLASRRRRYGAALRYWDRALRFPPSLGGRILMAQLIANAAELRVRLGLLDHADHVLAFGRRLLGQGMTAARAFHFGVVAAELALARGDSERARREISDAIVDGRAAGDQEYLGEAYRVAARVALADGDVERAESAVVESRQFAANDRGRAEADLLAALCCRARGADALPSALEALSHARACGDEDLLGEIYVLLALTYRDAHDASSARAYLDRAISLRDQVAAELPPDVRLAYLAKPDLSAIAKLHAALDADEDFDSTSKPVTQSARRLPSAPPETRQIVGEDPQIRALVAAVRKVAPSNTTVLIRGESGTGKELVAEALHRASDRARGPFVAVNCAALVETLLLSELFGHEKGAFTGASARRRGRFELAEGGTLFLDEIGDISPRTQVALLRVLQEKTFERVGGTTSIHVDVRVVCATHRDLRALVDEGKFREDLYYRLRGIMLEVPSLRARPNDLALLASHLLERIAGERGERPKGLSAEAVELLSRHRWPGNVRELDNVLRAVSLFAESDTIGVTDLIENVEELRAVAQAAPMSQAGSQSPPPPRSTTALSSPSLRDLEAACASEGDGALPTGEARATAVAYAQVRDGAISLSDIKRQIERDCIGRALEETGGNITRAAALLGMKRPRLSQLVKQYGFGAASEEL